MLIHCDYCGGAFDADKHATCPRCGAAWDKDAEAEKVEKERQRRAKLEQDARSTEDFLAQADAVRRTANSVGSAVGGVYRIFRAIVLILFMIAILIIAFVVFRFIL